MVKNVRRAELGVLGPLYLHALCQGAGLDASGSKAQLIDRLLKSEAQAKESPAEPTEPTEPTGETEPTAPEA